MRVLKLVLNLQPVIYHLVIFDKLNFNLIKWCVLWFRVEIPKLILCSLFFTGEKKIAKGTVHRSVCVCVYKIFLLDEQAPRTCLVINSFHSWLNIRPRETSDPKIMWHLCACQFQEPYSCLEELSNIWEKIIFSLLVRMNWNCRQSFLLILRCSFSPQSLSNPWVSEMAILIQILVVFLTIIYPVSESALGAGKTISHLVTVAHEVNMFG